MDNNNTLSEATQEINIPISDSPKIEAKPPKKEISTTPISDSPETEVKTPKKKISSTPISHSPKIEAKTPKKDSGLKTATPIHRLQLPKVSPKISTLTDRCMSPTDLLISPISKRLLSRNRKGSGLSAPPKNPSKEVLPLAI